MPRSPRFFAAPRWLPVSVGVLLLLLAAVELVLQLGAAVVWLVQPSRVPDAGGSTVLCVGDSFTYGVGADAAGSYPRQLERALHDAGHREWVVVNGAWPGQNSADVLARLPAQLERFRPRATYLLVGENDRWKLDSALSATAGAERAPFRWRWRTADLLALLAEVVTGSGSAAGPLQPALAGEWVAAGRSIAFFADGRLLVDGLERHWRPRGSRTILIELAPTVSIPAEWRREGDVLVLQPDGHPAMVLTRAVGPADGLARARADVAAGRFDDARRWFAAALGRDPLDVVAEAHLACLDRRAGDAAGAAARIGRLCERATAHPGDREAIAGALLAAGEWAAGIPIAVECLAGHPGPSSLWPALDLAVRGRQRGFERSYLRALETALGSWRAADSWRGWLLERHAVMHVVCGGEPSEVVCGAFEGALLSGQRELLESWLAAHAGRIGEQRLGAALDGLRPDASQRRFLMECVARATRPPDDKAAALTRNLAAIADVCRRHGSELRLLEYPEPTVFDPVLGRFAMAAGVRRIELRQRFTALADTLARDELFVADGHCTDRGYAVIADAVLADVLELMR